MNSKTSLIIILTVFILVTQILSTTIYSQPTFDIEIINIVEAQGGNLKTIIRINPHQTGTIDRLVVSIPSKFLGGIYYMVAYVGNRSTLCLKQYSENTTKIILSNLSVTLNEPIKIIIYQPKRIIENEKRNYIAKFLSSVVLNYPIDALKVNIKLPPDTRALKTPEGYTQYQITPGTVKPQLFRIEKNYDIEELSRLEEPTYVEINLTSIKADYESIKILNSTGLLKILINRDGKLTANLTLRLTNTGFRPWSDKDYISIYKKSYYKNFKAYTVMGRELEVNSTEQEYRIKLPYEVKPNTTVVITAIYEIINIQRSEDIFFNKIIYNVTIENLTEIPIDTFNIYIVDYKKNTIFEKKINNYTEYSQKINYTGEYTIKITDQLMRIETGLIILLIILGGSIYTGYQLYNKAGLKYLPRDVKDYINHVKKLIENIKEGLELEKLRSEKKISEREYFKRRTVIFKNINKNIKLISSNRKNIEKKVEKNENLKAVLNDLDELIKQWEELHNLEERMRRRRIKPEDYVEMRSSTIFNIRTYISKLEKRIRV